MSFNATTGPLAVLNSFPIPFNWIIVSSFAIFPPSISLCSKTKLASELLRLRQIVSSAQFSSNPWRSLRSVFVSQEIASYETKNRRPVKTCGCISGSPVLSLLSLSIHANHILFFEYANIRHMSIIMPHIIAIFICMVVI